MTDMDLARKQESHTAYMLLLKDFEEICAYVEPSRENCSVYSHRIYELFLRACTEFESLAVHAYFEHFPLTKSDAHLTIKEYRELEAFFKVEEYEVVNAKWRPEPFAVAPFAKWSTASPTLPWYSSYNKVKHNRYVEFQHANFGNLNTAISAVFLMLFKLGVVGPHSHMLDDDRVNHWYFSGIHSLRCPDLFLTPEA